jgi:hypothetical protein
MTMRKEKLSIEQQITHMKDKGIQFNIIDESLANEYLINNNYYFRLKAYAKNYEKYNSGENKGKYFGLEFAYLKELAVIDMQFRELVFLLTQDIEHYIKKQLINDIANENEEDGYSIITEVFTEETIGDICSLKVGKSACRDLILKYGTEWAVWNFVEILSLSETIRLYEFYYYKYPQKKHCSICGLLYSVRYMRNATAHNNCLLNSIRRGYTTDGAVLNISLYTKLCNSQLISSPEAVASETATGEYAITSRRLKHWMENPIIHDFIATIEAYKKIVTSQELKTYRLNCLYIFFTERVLRNKEYFIMNQSLVTAYKFIKKYLDYSLAGSI